QYVKQSDFNTAIQQLQQKQTDQQQQIDAIKQQMQSQFAKYDSQITAMQGRVSIDTVAHFAFNSATLSEQDKPALQDFAATIGKYHPGVLITVEGFADPAGSRAYNKKLGMQRADAVRDFLISSGLSADQVRAVSYGEDSNRQVARVATTAASRSPSMPPAPARSPRRPPKRRPSMASSAGGRHGRAAGAVSPPRHASAPSLSGVSACQLETRHAPHRVGLDQAHPDVGAEREVAAAGNAGLHRRVAHDHRALGRI